jgi:hypothetical protein
MIDSIICGDAREVMIREREDPRFQSGDESERQT